MKYLEHMTLQGDRWDLLAHHFYGEAARFEPIQRANPGVPLTPILPAGLVLRIPILEPRESEAIDGMPPWY